MSILWTEKDDNGIKALQYLKDNGKSLTLPDTGTQCLEFEIIDSLKANNFIMDLFKSSEEERREMENITGIRVKSVGFSQNMNKSEIRELLIQAIEKLS